MHGVALQSQGSQCVFNLQGDFLFVKFDGLVDWWRAEHQLQFPSTLHMYRMRQVWQIWQTRGGRDGDKSPVNNRKHKTRTAKTLGVEPFFCGQNKTQPKASLAADNRSPCHCTSQSAVLYVVLCTLFWVPHCSLVIDPKKIEKSCSNSFSGLIFQVLRTQRSSVSITLSVVKQKKQKVALRRWVFSATLNQPYIQHRPVCKSAPQTPTGAILWIAPIYFAARTFNELPKHLQSIKNLSEFKRRAQQHFLSYSCPCSKHPNRSA